MKPKILVVDDEKDICRALEFLLRNEGYLVVPAYSGEEAIEKFQKEHFDVILTDLKMEKVDGFAVLEKAKELSSDTQVLIMTAFASIESAVDAIRKGAADYIVKPFLNEAIRHTIRRVLEQKRLVEENIALRQQLSQRMGCKEFIGESEALLSIFETLEKVIPTKTNILILGESGTGKGLIADLIHCNSPRRDKPFISINCSAIPEGLLESELFGYKKGAFTGAVTDKPGLISMAHEGTLFLDEIGDMPVNLQAKLLKVLESSELIALGDIRPRQVDVRLITATNQDLEEKVKSKQFREDLYYRLNVIEVKIPPLRERKDDIPLFAHFFMRKFGEENKKKVSGYSSSAMQAIMQYPWPGNVRELKNVVERAVVLCQGESITLNELPEKLKRNGDAVGGQQGVCSLKTSIEDFEKSLIANTYSSQQKNKEVTAKTLGIDLATLYRKLKKYGIAD
ncbi:MAG TPA: sigma-54 dependent transcriptional regulator [Thermodesulfovibrionales bacterium]|nr:sigma-54 dependent transcriptional regulator [Thermodesulfovibrionales bacterium]